MAREVRGGDGQIEVSVVGDTVRLTQLGAGGGLELVVHCPTVTNLIKHLTTARPTAPPAGGAEIRFAQEGGEIPPQFEPLLPLGPSRPLAGVRLGGAQRVGSSAQFPSSSPSSSGGLTPLCGSYNQHYGD